MDLTLAKKSLFRAFFFFSLFAFVAMPAIAESANEFKSFVIPSNYEGQESAGRLPRQPGKLIVPLSFPEIDSFSVVARGGEESIEAKGYGHLSVPGKPMMPAKNLLIALPPGANVCDVRVEGEGAKVLEGTFRIQPAPPIVLLGQNTKENAMMQQAWRENNLLVYGTDEVYPGKRGALKGSGTLRKYAYASVAVYPFDYHPLSGKLVHYDSAKVIISYDKPAAGSRAARRTAKGLQDTAADERAASLFVNLSEVYHLYDAPRAASKGEEYDFVVLTLLSLYDTIAPSDFFNWKRSLGYNVVFLLVDDSGGGGKDDALAPVIRDYFRDHYLEWGTKYLLIIGDTATIPMRYCYPNPYWHDHNPSDPLNPGGSKPTDYYYADLSFPEAESWDSDGDGFPGEYGEDNPDFMPELYVGRIPTSNPSRILYTLDKLTAFEQDCGSWKQRAIHAGSILFYENQDGEGYPKVDSANFLSIIEGDFMNDWGVSRLSEHDGLDPSTFEWPALTEATFTSAWRNGRFGVVNWGGHGCSWAVARTVWAWDDGDGVPETTDPQEVVSERMIDVDSDLEDDYPSIVFAVSCNVGYPEANYKGNLGIDMLTNPACGCAAGIVSASRGAAAAAVWPDPPGGSQSIIYEFNRFMIGGPAGSKCLGEAIYDAKAKCHYNYGWDHIYEFQNMFVYNLYGDPTLHQEGISSTIEYRSGKRKRRF